MNELEKGGYSSLQKIQVTCRTCGVTESFYSNLSVDHFKLSHSGHDVVVSGEKPRTAFPSQKVVEANPAPLEEVARIAEPPPKIEPHQEEGVTRVAKVVVDTVMFPALSNPVLRIRGFTAELELAFVVSSAPGNVAKVRDVLARGEYLDEGSTGLRYVWDPSVIEFEEGTRERLGLPAEKKTTEQVPEALATPEPPQLVEDTVAATNEMLFGPPHIEEAEPVIEEAAPVIEEAPPTPAPVKEAFVEVETAAAPPPPVVHEEQVVEHEQVEALAPRRTHPAKRPRKKAQIAREEPKPRPPEEKEESLLVSKSWYVQGGSQNKDEAARISKVLKEFRWKVEPVYTIGVILDDILSIETSISEITRPLIERIEQSGYRLTAVIVEQGKPVAWFKRTPEEPTRRGSRDVSRAAPKAAASSKTVEQEETELADASSSGAPDPSEESAPEKAGPFGILDLTEPASEAAASSTSPTA